MQLDYLKDIHDIYFAVYCPLSNNATDFPALMISVSCCVTIEFVCCIFQTLKKKAVRC